MIRRIIVEVHTNSSDAGKLEEEFQIITKSDIYKIPVYANIMSATAYDDIEKESYALHNRSARKPNVREAVIGSRSGVRNQFSSSKVPKEGQGGKINCLYVRMG
jgi:hypothetical protein